jgi:hypothetical protein
MNIFWRKVDRKKTNRAVSENILRKIYFLKTIIQKAFTFFIKGPKSAEVYTYRNEKNSKQTKTAVY